MGGRGAGGRRGTVYPNFFPNVIIQAKKKNYIFPNVITQANFGQNSGRIQAQIQRFSFSYFFACWNSFFSVNSGTIWGAET